MNDSGLLELTGMEFHAFHGCQAEEKVVGNTFLVDFRGETDLSKPARTDLLADTVDLAAVYSVIRAEMEKPADLLEHVCGRIVDALHRHFPELASFQVTVSKKNPPLDGVCAWSRVTLTYGRNERFGF